MALKDHEKSLNVTLPNLYGLCPISYILEFVISVKLDFSFSQPTCPQTTAFFLKYDSTILYSYKINLSYMYRLDGITNNITVSV
jgi:hypothetical protein